MRNLNLITLLIWTSLMLVACTDGDETANDSKPWEEGELTEARLALVVNDYDVDMTRSEEPTDGATETATDEEKLIRNLWVFQYDDATGNKLINPRYYTITSQDELKDLPVLLKAEVSSTIYVVTNINSDTWAKNNDAFNTLSGLKAQTIPSPNPQSKQSATLAEQTICIPMGGSVSGKTVDFSSTTPIEISVTRMYAKLKIKPTVTLSGMTISSIEVNNISWSCQVASRYDPDPSSGEGPQTAYPTASDYWITRSMPALDDDQKADDGYDYIVYMPENIQGENTNSSESDKNENTPVRALKVTFHMEYTDPSTHATEKYDYVTYPGGNMYNNYNVRRNCVYRLNVKINSIDTETHTPSSNCFVMTPGQTLSFEPYNRVEIGGGFNIKDYLDAEDTEGKKVIEKVKILWQTTNEVSTNSTSDKSVIGDNSAGDLVKYDKDKKKIFVTTRNEGNALIAAYNSDNEILWSWHIWCTNLQPDNVATAITYTTYRWDNDKIYYDEDRIPGYAVMSCNIGALDKEPKSKNYTDYDRTYGMLYQWGRKDPFLPGIGNLTKTAQSYVKAILTALYDNENKRIEGITEGKKTSANEIFYSVFIDFIKTLDNTSALKFSINNPTVFMCGTPQNYKSNDLINYESDYGQKGDWLPTANHRLWGGLDPESSLKSRTISGYKLYDIYGEKSIFDPCPKGWRVPPPDLWMSFSNTGENPSNMDYVNYNVEKTNQFWSNIDDPSAGMFMYLTKWREGEYSFFPVQGSRRGDALIYRKGWCGNYHNATVSSGNTVNCLHIHIGELFNIVEIMYQYRVKSLAGPVRCVRDTK